MELSDYAKQVLFSSDLSTKLALPDELTDHDPGAPYTLEVPEPGRRQHLRFGQRQRSSFPKQQSLANPSARAGVLHYFANHELLALEIMALALLRFSDAPAGFRMGIAQTMREEVGHLHLYQSRMQSLGMGFGDLAVNRFFWDTLSGMRTPIDYAAQMSLTFEQANLDYSLHYQKIFAEHGDTASAMIMKKVYEEEIGHVKHGLTWFERLRPHEGSLWEEYSAALRPPMSPRRARGIGFDRDGRQRAGLPDSFTDRIAVYQASKGRLGRIWWFNPDCERQIGIGQRGGALPNNLQALAADYAPLMIFLANADDTLLLPRQPPLAFLKEWASLGVKIPELIEHPGSASQVKLAKGRKFSGFTPWGWEPNTIALRDQLSSHVHGKESLSAALSERVESGFKQWFSKGWAFDLRQEFCQRFKMSTRFVSCEGEFRGDSVEEVIAAIASLGQRGWDVCVKGYYGSSGRNAIRISPGAALAKNQLDWIKRNCRLQGGVVVERWYERVMDFGVQLDTTRTRHPYIGFSRFFTSKHGQYRAHVISERWWGVDSKVRRFLHAEVGWQDFVEELTTFVAAKLREAGYEGLAGVDCFVCRDSNGEIRLRPLIEINPRYTMGHVALAIEKIMGKSGEPCLWWHVGVGELPRYGLSSFKDLATLLRGILQDPLLATNPIEQATSSVGLLIRGEHDCRKWLHLTNNVAQA